MRTTTEIEDRIRYLLVEELDARINRASLRVPGACVYNYRHTLDVRKTVHGQPNENFNRITRSPHLPVVQTIGLCLLIGSDGLPMQTPSVEQWGGTICEDDVDAQRCPYFTPRVTKETLLVEFMSQLKDVDWLRENMPEVHSLLWVLQASSPPKVPLWKRILYRFLRISVEPLRPAEDIGRLLGA